MQVQALLKQTDKLPNVPDIVRELILLLDDPNAKYSDIATRVTHEQTISLKVLRIVNSAYFGLSRKIASIEEAIALLGLEKLKTLVIASGFVNSVSKVEGLQLNDFWMDSFRVAEIAQWFAKRTPLVETDEAFTAGVVHNVGRLLLHLAKPQLAIEIQTLVHNRKMGRVKAEMDHLGFTSQDAGKALMDLWKFPANLGIAVQQHKHPFGDGNDEPQPLACVLNLACYINACISQERDSDLVREGFPKAVANGAGLPESIVYDLDEALMIDGVLDQLLN